MGRTEGTRPFTTICFGDGIFVQGGGSFGSSGLGAVGSLFGHVLIALGPLRRLDDESPEAKGIRLARPHLSSVMLYHLETLESTRRRAGLHRSELILRIESGTGCI